MTLLVTFPASLLTLTAAGDVCGGGTGREFLTNLLDDGIEPWNKWFHLYWSAVNGVVSWIEIKCQDGEHSLLGYSLRSANDCPQRDPISWVVYGLDREGKKMPKPLHDVKKLNGLFSERWNWFDHKFTEPALVHGLRIEFRAVRKSGDGVQLGQVRLLVDPDAVPAHDCDATGAWISKSHIQLVAAGDAWGGGTRREYLTNLLNTSTEPWDKWFHPMAKSSWVMAKFVSADPLLVAGYGFCSANDCPHRDPVRWAVYAVDQNGTRVNTPLHTMDVTALGESWLPMRWQWVNFAFPNPVVAHGLVIEIYAVRAPGDGVQLGHLRIYQRLANIA